MTRTAVEALANRVATLCETYRNPDLPCVFTDRFSHDGKPCLVIDPGQYQPLGDWLAESPSGDARVGADDLFDASLRKPLAREDLRRVITAAMAQV